MPKTALKPSPQNVEVLGGVVPYFSVSNATEAAAFYEKAFRRPRDVSSAGG